MRIFLYTYYGTERYMSVFRKRGINIHDGTEK